MKNKKFLIVVFMIFGFIYSNPLGKTIRKKGSRTPHRIVNAKSKAVSVKTVAAKKAHSPKTVTSKTKKGHFPKKGANVHKDTSIYAVPANNRTPLITSKMNELKQKHKRVAKSGNISQKKSAAIEKKLLTSYSKWRGTKYAWGGDSKRGIDCSALTRRVYREVYSKELPRVSVQQIKKGRKVSHKNLKPGDIVYFRPEGRTNHTAVYVGNSLFINASSSKGVVMSSLKSPYWKRYFKYGVRVKK